MSTTGSLPTPVKAAPRSLPASGIVAVLVALALVALAVVAGHDLAARQGWITGEDSWLTPGVEALDGLTASVAVLVAAAALGVLGLVLAVLSFVPARTSHVRSAAPLSQAQTERLSAILTRTYGKPVTVHVEVDPELLSGLVVRVGDEVIDGTAAGRLAAVRKNLT